MNNIERNRKIYMLKKSGWSYRALAKYFGLSPKRIEQIVKREKEFDELENQHEKAVDGKTEYTFYDALLDVCVSDKDRRVATRVHRCLARSGVIRHMIATNSTLSDYDDSTLLKIRNFGTKSLSFARQADQFYRFYKEKGSVNA